MALLLLSFFLLCLCLNTIDKTHNQNTMFVLRNIHKREYHKSLFILYQHLSGQARSWVGVVGDIESRYMPLSPSPHLKRYGIFLKHWKVPILLLKGSNHAPFIGKQLKRIENRADGKSRAWSESRVGEFFVRSRESEK